MVNNTLILTAPAIEEDDDSIIGSLREQIEQLQEPKPRHVIAPEEYETSLEHYKDLRKPKQLGEVKEYIVKENKPMDDYSYFMTTAPRYKWQWALLLVVRIVLKVKAKARKIDRSGELFGALALALIIGGCIAGLCVR